MPMALYVTVLAIAVGLAVPLSAADRPSDPFGNHTAELDKEATLFAIWESLRDLRPTFTLALSLATPPVRQSSRS